MITEKAPKKEGKVKTVLVTGGAGYLGSVLCQKLLAQGYKVRALDNLLYGNYGIKLLINNKNFTLIKGDIRKDSDIEKSLNGADAVIHLAAIVGDPLCAKDPKSAWQTNYSATKNLIRACKKSRINKFIFASTCSVYGKSKSPNKELTEKTKLNKSSLSLYALTKAKCEEEILKSKGKNFSPTILRMATLYGYSPLMRFDLVANLFMAKAFFEKKITIFGGGQWRPWISVNDAADVCIACLKAPLAKSGGQIFNVLSENYKMVQVGKIVKDIYPDTVIEIVKRDRNEKDYKISNKKMLKIFSVKPNKFKYGLLGVKKALEKEEIKNYKANKYRISN